MAFPTYGEQPKSAFELSNLGKLGSALGTPNRAAVNATLLPLLKSLNPTAYQTLVSKVGRDNFGMVDAYSSDVLRAMVPALNNAGPAGNAVAMIGGLVGDTVLDPLSYIGIGGLTKLGKAASVGKTGSLAETLAEQFSQGQRSLFHFKGLTANVGETLPVPVPGEKAVWSTLDKVKQGNVLSSSVEGITSALHLSATPLVEKVKTVETYWNRMLQDFGIDIAVNPYLASRTGQFLSTLQGRSTKRVTNAVDTLGPDMKDFASDLARYYPSLKPAEVEKKLGEVVSYMHEAHPHLVFARNTKRFEVRNNPLFQGMPNYDREIEAIQEVMGGPPSMGGPASPFDTDMLRGLRKISAELLRQNDAIAAEEAAKLGRNFYLHTDPNAGYLNRLYSDNGNRFLEDRLETIFQAAKDKSGRFPSTFLKQHLARRMRTVDPMVLNDLHARGVLSPFTVTEYVKAQRKKVVRKFDPYKEFSAGVGKLVQTNRAFYIAKKLEERNPGITDDLFKLFPTPSAREANAWVMEKGLALQLSARGTKAKLEIRPGEIPDMFSEDPYQSLIARGVSSDRAILSKEYLEDLKGYPDLVQPAASAPSHWVPSLAPELDGFKLNPEGARWLNRKLEVEQKYPKHIENFLRGFSWANKHFKFWSLAPFPSTIMRNVVGDMWNYNLGSPSHVEYVQNLYRSKDAFSALYKGAGDTYKVKDTVNGLEYSAKEVYEKARDMNLWGSGVVTPYDQKNLADQIRVARQFPIEPDRLLLDGYKKSGALKRLNGVFPLPPAEAKTLKNAFTPTTTNWWLNTGFHLNQVMANGIRMAHVIQKVREGHTIEHAVLSAKKHLFDYQDLSRIEKDLFREFFPFYAWSRKNFPNILETLVTRPDKYARFNSALQGFNGYEVPEEERYINKFLIENVPTRIRKNANGQYEYFVFKNWLPLADVEDMLNIRGWAQRSLTPMLKVPLELAYNINWFTGRQLDQMNVPFMQNFSKDPGERSRFLGAMVPNRPVAHILRSARPLDFLHQAVDNPQELSTLALLGRYLAGRVYPLDVAKSYDDLVRQLEVMDRNTQKSIASALFREEPKEAERLFLQGALRKQAMLRERGME